MSAPAPKPHLWKMRGTWYCAVVYRVPSPVCPYFVPQRDGPFAMLPFDEPIGTGATLGEAGTVWRLVKHGRRYQSATTSPAP